MVSDRIATLRGRIEAELLQNILPFWEKEVVDPAGDGFWARVSNDLVVKERAPKGLILNTRILWTFSAASRQYKNPVFLALAQRAFDFIQNHFWDTDFGGMLWMLDEEARPLDVSKKIYGQAFSIYSLAEYFQATGQKEVLDRAIELYHLIERHNYDTQHSGYFETSNRDWSLAEDLRLSEVDMNEKKSMNTHLHLLEAYTQLYLCWPDAVLETRLRTLIDNFLAHIIDRRTHHMRLFFNEAWHVRLAHVSYGHDIEASWLLDEAAAVLHDQGLQAAVRQESYAMAEAVYHEALAPQGGIYYERKEDGQLKEDLEWWPQAEALVGFLNAWQNSGQIKFLNAAGRVWDFCDHYLVDHEHGEWFYKVGPDLKPDSRLYKVSEWKCPYHNSRACMEALRRLKDPGNGDHQAV